MKKQTIVLVIGILVVCFVIITIIIGIDSLKRNNSFLETLTIDASGSKVEELYQVAKSPEGTYVNQGFAIYNDVLFQLYNDDCIVLTDFDTGIVISELRIKSLHGDTMDFSNEFLNEDDEFPLAYITADTNPAKVFVVHITRSSTQLIRTYSFNDISTTGYYAGHCLNSESGMLCMVGYARENYYDADDNHMIVSLWDSSDCTINEDGSYSLKLLESFEIPFIITVQGQRYYEDRIYLLSSHNGVDNIRIDTKVYCVDIKEKRIVGYYDRFPASINTNECEGIEIMDNNEKGVELIISTCNATDGKYYSLH